MNQATTIFISINVPVTTPIAPKAVYLSGSSKHGFTNSSRILLCIKERPFSTKEQLENNDIYDVPRRLIAKISQVKRPHLSEQRSTQWDCGMPTEFRHLGDNVHPTTFQGRSTSAFEHNIKSHDCSDTYGYKNYSNCGSITSINFDGKGMSLSNGREQSIRGAETFLIEVNKTTEIVLCIRFQVFIPMDR